MTFSDPFTGAISSYWRQIGAWAANGTDISATGNSPNRLIYDIGDQAADGDVSVKVAAINLAAALSGVCDRWTDNCATNGGFTGYGAVLDGAAGTIKLVRFDAPTVSTFTATVLEDTGVGLAAGDTIGRRRTGNFFQALKNGVPIGVGVTDPNYASGGGVGIFDQDKHTYDDFSTPTNAAVSVPAIRVTHADGSYTDWPALLDSDRARGKALTDASLAMVPGDVLRDNIATHHTFDTGQPGTNGITAAAGTVGATLALVKYLFSGLGVTIIKGQATTVFRPATHLELRDCTIWQNPARTGKPLGHGSGTPDYSDVLISDCELAGQIDALHFSAGNTTVASIRLVRCFLDSFFDTSAMIAAGAASRCELINCTARALIPQPYFPATNPAQNTATTRAANNATANITTVIHGGSYTAAGGSVVNSAIQQTAGSMQVYGATLASSGANAKDLEGTITIGGGTVYDAGKTSGAITDVGTAYAPAPPTDLVAAGGPSRVYLTWIDNAINETGFTIEYATDALFTLGTGSVSAAANATSAVVPSLTPGTTYYFRVKATNATGSSTYSNIASVAPTAAADTPTRRRRR